MCLLRESPLPSLCAAAAAEKRQLKQYSQKTTSSWCIMEMKQVWLDTWRIKVIIFLLWWTGLHFQGSLGDICTPWQWTDTFTVPLLDSLTTAQCRMRSTENRKQKCHGSHVLLISQEDIAEPSSRFTQKLGPFCCSLLREKYHCLFMQPDISMPTGKSHSKFLEIHKYFSGYTRSSWITVTELCLEESTTKTASVPSFLLVFSFSSFLLWIFGHLKTRQPAWRQLQIHVW